MIDWRLKAFLPNPHSKLEFWIFRIDFHLRTTRYTRLPVLPNVGGHETIIEGCTVCLPVDRGWSPGLTVPVEKLILWILALRSPHILLYLQPNARVTDPILKAFAGVCGFKTRLY